MLDLDHFKAINDTHGHPAGDRVLRSVAELLRQRLRKTDVIGRVGGEEFAVLLPDADAADAARLLDELREAFAGVRQCNERGEFGATFSCGVVQFRPGMKTEELCALADRALYRAKRGGRNCVLVEGGRRSRASARGEERRRGLKQA